MTAMLEPRGLLANLLYSYLIYVTGVPMNRVFLVYVLIVTLSGAGLLGGLRGIHDRPPASTASPLLIRTTGWILVVTAVLFAGLWLSVLVPYALGGSAPEPAGVGGTPYPVFVLDLAVVLPAIAAVGVLLLLAASAWLTTRWLRSFGPVPRHPHSPLHERSTP